MKILILFLFTILAPLRFPQQNLTVNDYLQFCNIYVSEYDDLMLMIGMDNSELSSSESILNLTVIDILQKNEDGNFIISDDETTFLGIAWIEQRNISEVNWPSFQIIRNLRNTRYWLLVFPQNIHIDDNIENCGMIEIEMEL